MMLRILMQLLICENRPFPLIQGSLIKSHLFGRIAILWLFLMLKWLKFYLL